MANHKSAIKRIGVTQKNLRNRMIMSGVKSAIKKFDSALTQGDEKPLTLVILAP